MSVVAAAVIGSAAVGVYSANKQAKAASKAGDQQAAAAMMGVEEQQRQFDAIQNLLEPYVQAGTGGGNLSPTQQVIGFYKKYMGRNPNADTLAKWMEDISTGRKSIEDAERIISTGPGAQQYALSGKAPAPPKGSLDAQRDLLGLNGNAAQQAAINQLQGSPQFTSAMKAGEDAILSNASATGGLRGGNTQAALAQFRPQLLTQLINDQYTKLAGMSSMGLGAAGQTGQFGQAAANNVTNLLQQQGAALAGSSLAQGRAAAGYGNAITGAIGMYAGLGGFGGASAPAAGSGVISGGSGFRVM